MALAPTVTPHQLLRRLFEPGLAFIHALVLIRPDAPFSALVFSRPAVIYAFVLFVDEIEHTDFYHKAFLLPLALLLLFLLILRALILALHRALHLQLPGDHTFSLFDRDLVRRTATCIAVARQQNCSTRRTVDGDC